MTELKRTIDAIKAELAYWQGEKESDDESQADYARWEAAECMEKLDRIKIVSGYVKKYKGCTKD